MPTTTTTDERLISRLAEKYTALQAAVDALREPWQALRDPGVPWQQTLLALHDRQQGLLHAAEAVDNAVYDAAHDATGERAPTQEAFLKTVRAQRVLEEGVVTDLCPGHTRFAIAEAAAYCLAYPQQNESACWRAEKLVEAQRRYLHTALNPR